MGVPTGERWVWRDGARVRWQDATVSAFAHSMQRGSLVFDVASFHGTPRGPAIFRLGEHVARLLRSASLIGMVVPHTREIIERGTLETVAASGLENGLIRLSAFFPEMEPDLVPAGAASVVIGAYAPGELGREGAAGRPRPETWRVRIERDLRKPGPSVFPPKAKVAAAYLAPMIARRRALSLGFDEVLLLDAAGNVAEAPTANVFAVVRGELLTPGLGAVLDGITRDTVLTLAGAEGIAVREADITPETLYRADEVFLTSTSLPIGPVMRVDDHGIGTGAAGPITRTLRGRLLEIMSGQEGPFATMLRYDP